MNNIGDPLVLTASVVLAPGAEVVPNLASLSNPYGLPMELLEVRFSVMPFGANQTEVLNAIPTVTGLGIGVKADLGTIAVVDTDVPLSCFGSYRDSVNPTSLSSVAYDPTSVTTYNVETYTWRLKYPLYIPGGTTLNLNFHHLSQTSNSVKVWVTYHCRVRAKGYKPAKLMVPWVGSYNSKAFALVADAPADSDVSSELDLLNPFDVPLEVTRFVGAYTGTVLDSTDNLYFSNESVNPNQPRQYTFVTMRTSQGDDVVFSETPFEALWPMAWRAWDLPDGTQFDPGEWIKVTLTRTAIDYDPSVEGEQGSVQFAVSMIGYREIGGSDLASAAGGA